MKYLSTIVLQAPNHKNECSRVFMFEISKKETRKEKVYLKPKYVIQYLFNQH